MKYLVSLFLLISFYQVLYSHSYVDSLDAIIEQKVAILAQSSYKVEKIIYKIKKNIKAEISLQEIKAFLDNKDSIAFFFCDEAQLKLDDQISLEALQEQQSFKDLQFALGVKLYLYYLECAKQKMLNKAIENYDTLNFWQNEKFSEAQSFYQKNIFRCLSSSEYKERIEDNILQLQKITQQTDYFLGLIIHSQQCLHKAETQEEFEDCLMRIIQLQDDFLHASDQSYDVCDMRAIIKKSIDQLSRFSLHLSDRYAECQLPSHIVRHWEGYTATTVAACACAFIYLRYGEDIFQGAQYFWDEHMQGPVNRTINVLSGYTQAPQVDTEKHKQRIIDLVEAGVKKAPARGDETSLHDALVNDLDQISNGEFTQAYQKIDKKMEEVDCMVEKVKLAIDRGEPIVGELSIWHERFQDFKRKHPNMLWGDISKYFAAMHDPAFPDVYEKGSRDWTNLTAWQKAIFLQDVSKPMQSKNIQTQAEQPALKQDLPEESVQATFRAASGEFGQAMQDAPRRLQEQAPDTTNWTPSKKKEYYENQLKIIKANPYKNILRLGEPVDYKIEDESIQSKEIGNIFAKDAHMILSLTALIPVITVVGGSLFASKTLYNSVAYQPIRTLVRRLEVLLNEAFYQDISFEREGRIYFLTEQLKLNIGVLTIPEQKLIETDIVALQSEDLDYVQKFHIVQRMYRTYPCLVPATI